MAAAAGTFLAGIAAMVGTLVAAPHQSAPTATPCAVIVGQYETDLQRDPRIITALDSIVPKDPNARRCGITAVTLRTMINP
jgi:hypothetical protein